MSFTLVPKNGEDVQINGWQWRPTLELLRANNLLSQAQYEQMAENGTGVEVDAELAARFADAVEHKLSQMNPGDLMRGDLTLTNEQQMQWAADVIPSESDVFDYYSASYEWLMTFADFCKRSGGFEVF